MSSALSVLKKCRLWALPKQDTERPPAGNVLSARGNVVVARAAVKSGGQVCAFVILLVMRDVSMVIGDACRFKRSNGIAASLKCS